MLTGLFMSIFLIGALWFVIGIGDAIVFRDTMQEAADHGAFTSSSMNAKGMNLIALLNLVMVAGTAIHIVLGLITDIAGAIHAVCIYSTLGGDPECLTECLLSEIGLGECPTYDAWNGAFKIWDGYYTKIMKPSFDIMHKIQKAASFIYPITGSVEAFEVGRQYSGDGKKYGSVNVMAVSASMLPEGLVRKLGDQIDKDSKSKFKAAVKNASTNLKKEGNLPVEPKKNAELCKKVVSVATSGIANMVGLGGIGGGGITGKLSGGALKVLNALLGSGLAWRYCNEDPTPGSLSYDPWKFLPPIIYPITGSGPGWDEDFWKKEGFYVVYDATGNGDTYMQTWATSLQPGIVDNSESNVKLAGSKPIGYSRYTKNENHSYFAQAEFYFNCDEEWSTVACNFEDNALFAIKWRARLRRLQTPNILSTVVETGLSALTASVTNDLLKSKMGGVAAKIAGALGAGAISQSGVDTAVNTLTGYIEDVLKDITNTAVGKIKNPLEIGGIYH